MKSKLTVTLLSCSLVLAACGGGGGGGDSPPASRTAQVSWTANRESGVNGPGGGYKVYYSSTAGFDITTANVADVPNAGGATPTTTNLTLISGTHYVKVVAYSALNPVGSTPSTEISVTVP